MLRNLIYPEMDLAIDQHYFWTDSMAVLGYIANSTKRFQVFTANRIAQIRSATEAADWHWIPSALNPADIISRGINEKDAFNETHVWFRGPDFLFESQLKFPDAPSSVGIIADDDPELRKKQTNFATISEPEPKSFTSSFMVKFESWRAAKMAAAILRKFCLFKLRGIAPSKVSCSDVIEAEKALIRVAQRERFSEEFEVLSRKPDTLTLLQKGSPIRKLCPMVGTDGLMRVGGRLAHAAGSYDFKHPIILPKRHHVTESLIRQFHDSTGHGSVKEILNEMRAQFHIVGGRSTVHAFWTKCMKCRRQIARAGEQYMHDLPKSRLTPFYPAFTFCALDLFGHFFVKIGRSRVKRWGVIFICQNSRAVHIEIVQSLDMNSFMNALRRMIGRRGRPQEIRSDQGSNLKAAEKELSEALMQWNESNVEQRLRQENIRWIFVPPKASHMNGLAERIIRSARAKLVHLLYEQTLTDETLSTLMVECESMLNQRPIAEFSSDPSDGRALTPAHLLQPRSQETDLPAGIFEPHDNVSRKRWRQVQYLANVFWKRLIKEVYQTLQRRQKWLQKLPNYKIGDLVLLVDENIHRNDWRFGRIMKVKWSDDGLVRSCTLKVQGGLVLDRPVAKLCIMEAAEL